MQTNVHFETPIQRVGHEVEYLVGAFSSSTDRAIYISTPITTGKEYFRLLQTNGSVSAPQRAKLRAKNRQHALEVISRVRKSYPQDVVIEPLSLEEPAGWSQDHFNAFWMLVIHKYAKRLILVDGWEYSTGCTWEVSQALADGLPICDERLSFLSTSGVSSRLREASSALEGNQSWTQARDTALHQASSTAPARKLA